jgi:Bax protein
MTIKRFISTIFLVPFLLASFSEATPSFRSIKDHQKRRKAFIEFVAPQVHAINTGILEERTKILSIYEEFKKRNKVTLAQQYWLKNVAAIHNMNDFDPTKAKSFDDLLLRVDIIPVPLALAQAGNESAWGTSKFAVQGNNYFGHFCKARGCGIVPGPKGRENSSEAKKFASPFESIKAYIQNLNSHKAYEKLRLSRAQLRKAEKPLDGALLAEGLERYSTRGKAYVRDIKTMIRAGGLEKAAMELKVS